MTLDNITGWIPPEVRDIEQTRITRAVDELAGHFGVVGNAVADIPKRVIFEELEVKHTGSVLPRVWQVTGSCVGSAAAVAYLRAALGDVVHRGDREAVKMPFPFATYGVGRDIGGMRRKGEGSFGQAQAKAVDPENFGMLAWDDERVPKPEVVAGNWWRWTKNQELTWSHPSGWPVQRRELYETSEAFGMHTITRVRNPEQWRQLIAQGYGVTLASMFGTRPRVEKGVLLGRKNTQWAHQMSSSGYWNHPDLGWIYKIDNQWGPGAHGDCPVLKPLGCTGSFWILESDAEWICRTGEVFGHSSTGGFPAREWLWGPIVTYED